ncbi:hypothetical protein C9994_10635 [Marivirga lumbricoides]|uniref:Apea-like HEPN domain-containing protein n=1 Tax=Marivirga lumbricoides TaxID=1046115 RepID=A0A2T4DPG9_9BACT|nr:hypothetical protein C9994_10635 [Marivirga lumbricoides]
MILDWINRNYGISLSEAEVTPIMEFTLLWNVFENRIFSTDFTIVKLEDWINNNHLDLNPIHDNYLYFQSRYINPDDGIRRFNVLFPNNRNEKETIYSILISNNSSEKEKLYALGVIAYRLRNNLFHGNKTIEELPWQVVNFTQINQVLMFFLEQE